MKLRPFALMLVVAAAAAQPATPAELAAQRATIEQQFSREQADCQQRFAVANCLEQVRQRRHDALAPLVRHEHELAAAERRQLAQAQTQRVRERELAAAQDEGVRRERAAPAVAPPPAASHPVRARSAEQAAQARQGAERKAEAAANLRRERARVRALEQRQRIAAHEAKEKQRGKPPAAPLPLPAGMPASAASRP